MPGQSVEWWSRFRLPYRAVAPYSAVAALLWAAAETGAGYAAASFLQRVVTLGVPVVTALVVVVAAVSLWAKRRRGRPDARRGDEADRTRKGPRRGALRLTAPSIAPRGLPTTVPTPASNGGPLDVASRQVADRGEVKISSTR
ncbi:hypothetical protein GCM10010275_43640 [Streptomyces litmocidini]|nr:hypothetical protein GCM10010275_43640 [Streptomyces litmocidini]